ncbi:MAG: hypothetical protein MUF07_12225 [Steroidobacteraceae bacterium]|jgi:ElaB/YqjD/DUF883 family membrane-anchored ribosome-binding protein|nr:hypothetical protein [Steroidobacteraceae bacterium]
MNATPDSMGDPGRAYGGAGAGQGQRASEMNRFFADVEDLLKRVTHMNDADVARLRERVETSLSSARDTVTRGASRVRESADGMVETTDEYVRRKPWTVAGIAMVAGALIGAALLSSRR